MKIMINYDLMDKVRESKIGISLNTIVKKTGLCSSIAMPILSIDNITGVEPPLELVGDLLFCLLYYGSYYYLGSRIDAKSCKLSAEQELRVLSHKLKDIFVDTDPELLKEVVNYQTKYSVNFKDSIIPRIEQKKYFTVPVHSDWDNNTRSLMQEHIIGSHQYVLSHGEPEHKKVYSLGTRQMISK